MSTNTDILIIGAGASGLAAAIEAGRTYPGARILLTERADRAGKKLLVTGNGRCNLSNSGIDLDGYNPEAGRYSVLMDRYEDDAGFFRSLGLLTFSDAQGRMYPLSGQASSVLDTLRFSAVSAGAEIICGAEVTDIGGEDGAFTARTSDGQDIAAGKVIIAAGSPAGAHGSANSSLIASLKRRGEHFREFSPALVYISVRDLPAQLKGTRVQASVTLETEGGSSFREEGELQFGDGYISGICVMDLSRHYDGKEKASVIADLCPGTDGNEIVSALETARVVRSTAPASSALAGIVPKAIGETVLKSCCRDVFRRETSSLTDIEIAEVSRLIKGFRLRAAGKGAFRNAQICTGGFWDLGETTLESRTRRGLYFCGEIVDVDGRCGGYNLHWAWASGRAAGAAAAASLKKDTQR